MKNKLIFSILSILIVSVVSCKKGPGIGGKATIKGKVYEYNYNNSFTSIKSEYYKGNQDVYIVYGEEDFYADKIETHYDGTFEFKYLLPGKYTIYTYSSDTAIDFSREMVVKTSVEIVDRKEMVNAGILKIYDI